MKAFAEQLCPCGCLVIRVGPETDHAPIPYDYMIARSPTGEFKGLTRNPEGNGARFTKAHYEAITEVVEGMGLGWRFERTAKGCNGMANTYRNVWRWLLPFSLDWIVIVAAMWAIYFSLYLIPIAALVIGNRQHALAILGHEGSHRAICRDSRLNDFLSSLCFWAFWINFSGYRRFHLSHHAHLGTDLDPEVPLKAAPGYYGPTLRVLFDLLGRGSIDLARFALVVGTSVYAVAFQVLAFAALYSLGLWWVYVAWHLCIVTTFWFFFRIRVWTEHNGEQTIAVSRFLRPILTPHNTWMHEAHHDSPTVPFYRLGSLACMA